MFVRFANKYWMSKLHSHTKHNTRSEYLSLGIDELKDKPYIAIPGYAKTCSFSSLFGNYGTTTSMNKARMMVENGPPRSRTRLYHQ